MCVYLFIHLPVVTQIAPQIDQIANISYEIKVIRTPVRQSVASSSAVLLYIGTRASRPIRMLGWK